MKVLAFDPGAVTGWALFLDGILAKCGKLTRDKSLEGALDVPNVDVLIVEKPVIYPGGRQKQPPNDILQVGIHAGQLAGLYKRKAQLVELVTPLTWKGTVPKEIHQPRILEVLTPQEKSLLVKNHNTVDAVGIGLWRLRRLRR